MPAITDPNLGLNYGWTLGESGWGAGMDAFRDYHHNQAMLRILSKSANLQTASQARRPKIARPVRLA